MNNVNVNVKEFDAVSFFRNVKEQIAKEFKGKTFEEKKVLIKELLEGKRKLKPSS